MKLNTVFIVALLISGVAFSENWVKPIDITGHVPETVKQIASLIDEMAKDITSCLNAGNKRDKCICAQRNQHEKLRSMYKQVITRYPQWTDKAVSYREGSTQHVVSFVGIKLQLQYFDRSCR
ncbi:hypothetical protein [Hydrogenivirga sp.]